MHYTDENVHRLQKELIARGVNGIDAALTASRKLRELDRAEEEDREEAEDRFKHDLLEATTEPGRLFLERVRREREAHPDADIRDVFLQVSKQLLNEYRAGKLP